MNTFLTLHHPALAAHYYASGVWGHDTFYSLLENHAQSRPSAPALRDASHQLSWQQLKYWVDALAADFERKGLVRGDRLSMWLSSRAEAVVTFIACSRQGIANNPSLHRTFTCREVSMLLARLDAAGFLTEAGWGADREQQDLDELLLGLSTLKADYRVDDFIQAGNGPETVPVHDPDAVAYLAFTSGTTGEPKCVMHSSNTLLANARDMVKCWHHGSDMKLMSLSPVSHHIAWVGVAQWLLTGGEFITCDPPSGMSTLDWLIESQADYVMGVPTHAMDILTEQRTRGIKQLGSVKVFYMAGAAIPPSVAQSFVDQGIKPQNVYGMTENSSHHFTHPTDDADTIVTTCGRGGGAYEVAIFDSDNAASPLPAGEVGQIGGRGGALMLGYFDNQRATRQSFNTDGWFLSGDLGSLDDHGNLCIEGRLKDMIIRGGHNIYPTHIEAFALRHEKVQKVAVFAVPDERLGEKACMAIIGDVTADVLLRFLDKEGLSKYDMPEYFVNMEAFPLTASGKILKRELIQMVKTARLHPTPCRWTMP